MVYIVAFFISTLFIYLGDQLPKKYKYFSAIFIALGVLIVSVLAGARALTIGTDIQTYGEWLFSAALKNHNLISYVRAHSDIDMFFLCLVFGVARFFSDSHWLYFAIALIQYGFTLAGLYHFRDKIPVPFSWLCFLLIFYGDTLNAMRQFIGIAIAFWAFDFFIKSQYKKYLIWTIVAVLFHNTAIISFLIAGIYFILKKKNTLYTRVGIIAGAFVLTGFYSYILLILMRIGILNSRFERYISSSHGFELNPLIIRIPFIILIFLLYKRFSNYKSRRYGDLGKCNTDFIIIILLMEIITAELRAVVPALYRISFYFGYGKMIAYSRIAKIHPRKQRLLYSFLIIAFLIVLWIYQNVYQGNNDIYPYESSILGIG